MEKRFSTMTDWELDQEIADLKIKIQKAEQMGMINEVAVHERKLSMAEAYKMDPKAFKPGEVYNIKHDDGPPLVIKYMNGVFAWGAREGFDDLVAYPISLLQKKEDEK